MGVTAEKLLPMKCSESFYLRVHAVATALQCSASHIMREAIREKLIVLEKKDPRVARALADLEA